MFPVGIILPLGIESANMKISRPLILVLLVVMTGCEGQTPQSEGASRPGATSKQTVDKLVNEANKAIDQGEARTREAIDGSK